MPTPSGPTLSTDSSPSVTLSCARASGSGAPAESAAASARRGARRPALRAETLAAGAQRAVLLDVRTPSHTPLLAAAGARFRDGLAAETLERPGPGAPRLVAGLDGSAVFDARAGLDKLARQISETIDWAACLTAAREFGAEAVLELGPGHALATMARDALPEARVHALADFRSAGGVRDWIAAPRHG
ncbi:hypothetical protein [Methylobacterium hispanicum]|uniref:hypothetical protein n=1 Tax=Methylobacterium hispanicum TaxID=270350 RepID=UPI003AF9A80D